MEGWDSLDGDVYAELGKDFNVVVTNRHSLQTGFLWIEKDKQEWLVPSVTELSLRSDESLTFSSASSKKLYFETVSMTTPSEFMTVRGKDNCNPNSRKKARKIKEFTLPGRMIERREGRGGNGSFWSWFCFG